MTAQSPLLSLSFSFPLLPSSSLSFLPSLLLKAMTLPFLSLPPSSFSLVSPFHLYFLPTPL